MKNTILEKQNIMHTHVYKNEYAYVYKNCTFHLDVAWACQIPYKNYRKDKNFIPSAYL